MKKKLLVVYLALISTSANAGWAGDRTPVYMYGAQYIVFGVAGVPPSDTCSYYNRQFRFDGTTPTGKNLLSMLLAAKMGGKTIDIWYTPSTAPGTDHTNGCTESSLAVVNLIGIR